MTGRIAQRITPFLWFDTEAEEAMNFYVSIFKNSKTGMITRFGDTGPGPKGSVMTASFTLDGQEFVALNGGPQFPFTEAVSFMVNCDSQEEVDYFWDKLSAGGKEVQCGWLKDKYGLAWQIVPTEFFEMISNGTQDQADRVMTAMMQMVKMDLAKLKQAYHGN